LPPLCVVLNFKRESDKIDLDKNYHSHERSIKKEEIPKHTIQYPSGTLQRQTHQKMATQS